MRRIDKTFDFSYFCREQQFLHMENNVNNPLVIRCKGCGGKQSFNIARQQYICAHCGSVTELDSQKAEFRNWRRIQQQRNLLSRDQAKTFACPSCGAQTIASADDASTKCPFCQNTMVDANFSGTDLPEVIIPFKITQKEAEAKLRAWLAAHKSNTAAQTIEKNMSRFTGCYLPYHIVRGALEGDMSLTTQSGEAYKYPFKAYLSHTVVNASKDWNNMFLDGIEPFDFDDTRAFDFRYLNEQKAKIQNVEAKGLTYRIQEETKRELYDDLSEKVRTKEVSVIMHDQDNESVRALMPVYLLQCENGIAAAVNGQTGKVSVATGKKKNLTGRWWIWPTLATLAITIIGTWFGSGRQDLKNGLELGIMAGMVFGMVFFAIAHTRHHDELVDEILTEPKTKKSHNDTHTEFFADFGEGPVPAILKFFTPWRIIKTVLNILAVIFLPVLIAVPIQLLRGLPLSDIQIGYGAAWYCIPGFFAILAAGGLAKAMMYGMPLYYEILPDGSTRRRKANAEKTTSMKEILANTKFALNSMKGCLVIGFIIFLLIGSVAAMLF